LDEAGRETGRKADRRKEGFGFGRVREEELAIRGGCVLGWVYGAVVSVAEVVWRLHYAEGILGELILILRRANGWRKIPTVERIVVVRVHVMEVHIEVLGL
jgi:hypothetical protein